MIKQVNAKILIAHTNPTLEYNEFNINGNMIPPTEPPRVARPIAIALFFLNQCDTTPINGFIHKAHPNPQMIPNPTIKVPILSALAVMNNPPTINIVPNMNGILTPVSSNNIPDTIPAQYEQPKNSEKIHAVVALDTPAN
ncbi:unnamed protein product [[Candida] boidinii]|nr:unnamed protein product [[Candida] boidinii]